MLQRFSKIVLLLVLTIAAAALILAAFVSLRWRYVHDSPIMVYAGYLVAHGAVPYRDFFDINMPGTYFTMWFMGSVFGWNDIGFRVFDLLSLASIVVATFWWMKRFGKLPALVAALAFPLWYLHAGPPLSMQREYIALVPFAWLLALVSDETKLKSRSRYLFAGILAGMTLLIKPQFFVLSLPLLFVLLRWDTSSVGVQRRTILFVGGISIPLGATFLYLLFTGSLGPFIDIVVNYWPLYSHLTETHTTISGLPRLLYLAHATWFGLFKIYVPTAIVGLFVLSGDSSYRRSVWMFSGLLVAAAIYPALSGQFWNYHWIPFYYVLLCASSLAARPIERWSFAGLAPIGVAISMMLWLSSKVVDDLRISGISLSGESRPKDLVADEIARFLRAQMKPGDTVQPLDWTGGAVHAMLMVRAPLATRFIYDFHFYHHVNNAYIGKLRREFMIELTARKPRFIIQVLEFKPWPRGPNTTRHFPELQEFLEQCYATAQQGATYRILERKEDASKQSTRGIP